MSQDYKVFAQNSNQISELLLSRKSSLKFSESRFNTKCFAFDYTWVFIRITYTPYTCIDVYTQTLGMKNKRMFLVLGVKSAKLAQGRTKE